MKKIVVMISLLIINVSCAFNGSYENEESEKKDAEKVADDFYEHIKNKEYTFVAPLFSEQFFKVVSKQQLLDIILKTNNVLGNYKSKKIINWKTQRVVGSNPSNLYILIYEVEYEKYKATETMKLIKNGNRIEIYNYHIDSEGFLKIN